MATKYASLDTRKTEEKQIAQMEDCMSNPISWQTITAKEKFKSELAKRKKRVEAITPPDLKGDEVLAAKRRHDMLRDAWVEGVSGRVPSFPTRRQMEQAPAGAVDQHMQHDQFWKRHNLDPNGKPVPVNTRAGQQNLQSELKDKMRLLGKESEEWSPNIANLELFRRENDNVPLADTRLPRSYGLTPAARANYEQAFPDHTPTPVERKLRARTVHSNPCGATTKSGTPCKAGAAKGTAFCAFHQDFVPVLDAPIPLSAPVGG